MTKNKNFPKLFKVHFL